MSRYLPKVTSYTVDQNSTVSHTHHISTPRASLPMDEADQAGAFFCCFKPALNFQQQLNHLIEKGLIVPQSKNDSALELLSDTNYYRLRGYWLTLEKDDRFIAGTTVDDIESIVLFDAQLRHWFLKTIEPLEVKARTQFAYQVAHAYGPGALMNAAPFNSKSRYMKAMSSLSAEISRGIDAKQPCIVHNMNKYGQLPIWAQVEVMTFGQTVNFLGNLKRGAVSKAIAQSFGYPFEYVHSWLTVLCTIRNIAAHGGRLYNLIIKSRPKMLKLDRGFDGPKEFPIFIILRNFYQKSWPGRWAHLLNEFQEIANAYPLVSLEPMGFPVDWLAILSQQDSFR